MTLFWAAALVIGLAVVYCALIAVVVVFLIGPLIDGDFR